MPVGVLAVIWWNNPWPNTRLQLGSSVVSCTPQTLSETNLALKNHCQTWTRNALSQKCTVCRAAIIPENWKIMVLQFGDSCCNILHMEGLQSSRRQRMTWDSNTALPLLQCDKTGLKSAGLCSSVFSCSTTALKRMQALLFLSPESLCLQGQARLALSAHFVCTNNQYFLILLRKIGKALDWAKCFRRLKQRTWPCAPGELML